MRCGWTRLFYCIDKWDESKAFSRFGDFFFLLPVSAENENPVINQHSGAPASTEEVMRVEGADAYLEFSAASFSSLSTLERWEFK